MARRPGLFEGTGVMAIGPVWPKGQGQPCSRPMGFKVATGCFLVDFCRLKESEQLSGTGRFATQFARIDSRESFAIETVFL